MKVVINKCHGGFGLSEQAVRRYLEIQGKPVYVIKESFYNTYSFVPPEERVKDSTSLNWRDMTDEERSAHNRLYREQTFQDRDIERNDPILIQVVEELGKKASGRYAELAVVDIPEDVDWEIDEYDGMEWVAEKHRTWQ